MTTLEGAVVAFALITSAVLAVGAWWRAGLLTFREALTELAVMAFLALGLWWALWWPL